MADSRNRNPEDLELRKLLPRYVKGHLTGPMLARVEAFLARSPDARAEVEWLRRREREAQALRPQSRDAAFARFMQQLVPSAPVLVPAAPPRRRNRPRWLTPMFGIAVTVAAVEAALIGALLHEREAAPPVQVRGARLTVTFHSGATEAQIRELLQSVEATIVSGPGARGAYTLDVATGQAEAATARLAERRDVVRSVGPAD
jgi:anti-sigma factor RsiW